MPRIIVVGSDGTERTVEAQVGLSVMEALRPLDIGVAGECEGSIACATCHVKIAQEWFERLGPPSNPEMEMLDLSFSSGSTSRLSCQIMVTHSLDGLRLATPDQDP
jgi:2Fe-2S ferredoxin